MNVDRRWLGTSVVRVRALAAGLVLLAAGSMVLGGISRSRHIAAVAANDSSLSQSSSAQSSLIPDGTAASPLALASNPSEGKAGARIRATSILAGLPLMFEPNQGQANLDPADVRAKFVARGPSYGLFLGPEGAILSLRSHAAAKGSTKREARVETLQMKLAGANPNASLSGADLLPGKSNYFLGSDPAKWHHNVPQFARVRYENVYPGINLVFYGNQGHLE